MQTIKKTTTAARKNISEGSGKKMNSNLFHNLFIDELKDIYWAEKHLVKNLPKMAKASTTEELRTAFINHLHETEEQVKKLERVFELLNEKAVAKKCEAMDGLVEEASDIMDETEKGTYTRDAALITAAQKVEHYEIASYGSLVEFAKTMEHSDAAAILSEILEEEKNADSTLNNLAKRSINEMALNEWDEDENKKDDEE